MYKEVKVSWKLEMVFFCKNIFNMKVFPNIDKCFHILIIIYLLHFSVSINNIFINKPFYFLLNDTRKLLIKRISHNIDKYIYILILLHFIYCIFFIFVNNIYQ